MGGVFGIRNIKYPEGFGLGAIKPGFVWVDVECSETGGGGSDFHGEFFVDGVQVEHLAGGNVQVG